MIRILSTIAIIACCNLFSAWAQDGIKLSAIDTTSRLIVAEVWSPTGIKGSASLIINNWYASQIGEKFLAQYNEWAPKQAQEMEKVFGKQTGTIQLMLSTRIDSFLTVIYLKGFSIMELPIQFVYIKKGELYYIMSIQMGLDVLKSVDKFHSYSLGKIPSE